MYKKNFFTLAISGMLLTANLAAQTPAIPQDEAIEQQIESLLAKMTLEE